VSTDLLIAILGGSGGTAFVAALYRVVQTYRADRANSEGTLVERLDTRLQAAEKRMDELTTQRDKAREEATRYRLLAIAKGATPAELAEAGS
jgi:hypothetical protein